MDQAAPQGGQFNNLSFGPGSPFPFPSTVSSPPTASTLSTAHVSSQQPVTVDVPATKVESTSMSEIGDKTQLEEAKPKKAEELLQSDPSYLKESIKASPVETQSVKEVSTWHVRKQLLYFSMMLLLKYHLVLLGRFHQMELLSRTEVFEMDNLNLVSYCACFMLIYHRPVTISLVSRCIRENDGRSDRAENGLPVSFILINQLKHYRTDLVLVHLCDSYLPEEMRNPETFKCMCSRDLEKFTLTSYYSFVINYSQTLKYSQATDLNGSSAHKIHLALQNIRMTRR
ncbi:hypothetical protein BHE74_00017717 [Ensete ventricosum]|nr:hypothetical protein GW17_00014314 [Ensete ventricosum]RWW74342.1 hypothetical protein BHE74_00017717 [Ensete ventricosum]RZS04802.1 hypothetical protein BHM03_00035184 [Ensete ventricosum]